MPQSLSSILIHPPFQHKTSGAIHYGKDRKRTTSVYGLYVSGVEVPIACIDGTEDHIHALFSLSRIITIAELVEEVKTESPKWIKTKGKEFRNFHWQSGYGAFSIGESQVSVVKRYIARQKIHHQRISFQDEYRKFLKSYGIDYDERYVWD